MSLPTDHDIYDGMTRIFLTSMSGQEIPTGIAAMLMGVPVSAMRIIVKTLPLPAHVTMYSGGHRNHTLFFKAEQKSLEERTSVVGFIRNEKLWDERGLILAPAADLVEETSKVISNLRFIKETGHKDIQKRIEKGDPKAYRPFWFIKDTATNEFFRTISEALVFKIASQRGTALRVEKKEPRAEAPPAIGEAVAPEPVIPLPAPPPERKSYRSMAPPQSTLRQLIYEVSQLIGAEDRWLEQEKAYKGMIEELTSKINSTYGEIIAKKAAENATLQKEINEHRAKHKALEKEIHDLNGRLARLSEYVAKKGKDPDVVRRRTG